MNRSVLSVALFAGTTAALLGGPSVAAADLIPTTTAITFTGTTTPAHGQSYIQISGDVTVASGAEPVPDGDHVAVIWYRRGGGAWNLKFESKPLLQSQQYTMGFLPDRNTGRRGTCKEVVRFHGDATHGPSATHAIVYCGTGVQK